jgi:hypothetical protein
MVRDGVNRWAIYPRIDESFSMHGTMTACDAVDGYHRWHRNVPDTDCPRGAA